jgi:hypothetical protein
MMPTIRDNCAAWKTLLRIAEQPHAQMSGRALRRACGGSESSLVKLGALIRTPGTAAVPLNSTHDSDDDAFEDGYEHLPIPGLSQVAVKRPTNDPHLYRLSIDWLVRTLTRSLGTKHVLATTELLPDLLWRLGEVPLGGREPIFFVARRIFHGDNLAQVRAELSSMLGQQPFVMLTTAPARLRVALPPGLRLVSLHDCACLDGDSISLDHSLIADVARSAFSTSAITGKFWHSPTYDVVRLQGVEFRLGPIRREVVRQLHEASKTDRPWVPGKLLLPDATKRMVDTFKSLKPSWRLLIESDERGNYRLNL